MTLGLTGRGEAILPLCLRGPANSPLEADCNRHLRPVETATPGRRHRAVRRGKLPLTNNFYLVRREFVN